MKLTYTEFAKMLSKRAQHAVTLDSYLALPADEAAGLLKLLTDVMPLLADVETCAATVPTVELTDEDECDTGWVTPTVEHVEQFFKGGLGYIDNIAFHTGVTEFDPGAGDDTTVLAKVPANVSMTSLRTRHERALQTWSGALWDDAQGKALNHLVTSGFSITKATFDGENYGVVAIDPADFKK